MKHTDTRIFQRSLELIDVTRQALDALPTGYGFLADQLRRAAGSVTLNFAEGSAKRSARERRRYFDIARGSAYEVAAALAVGERFGVTDMHLREQAEELADHLGAMLTRFR